MPVINERVGKDNNVTHLFFFNVFAITLQQFLRVFQNQA